MQLTVHHPIFTPNVRMIVALSANHVIGINNALPWHIPADLQLFKQKTLHQHVLMGHNTFKSILSILGKPLPNRTCWVLTTQNAHTLPVFEHVNYVNSIDLVLNCLKYLSYDAYTTADADIADIADAANNINVIKETLWVIGGSHIYQQALQQADWACNELHVTHVHQIIDGDAHIHINWQDWQVVQQQALTPMATIATYVRKQT